jgi:HAD superfamily hydrolase (TIGR01458 family)
MRKGMEDVKGIIFDVDGVLKFRGQVYPDAIQTVEELREKSLVLRFLTNSTLNSRASLADKLNRSGFQVSTNEIITASYATAVYLKSLNPRSCWVMVEREGREEFNEFVQDTHDPEYIVVGDNRSQFDFDHLNYALRLLMKGAKLIGMQSELLDNSMGELELNVGSWVGLLERASGVQATYIGMPNSFSFELALQTMHLSRRQVLMVGDRVETDVRGAQDFGLRSVLVRTGEFDPSHLDGTVAPDVIIDSIQDLLSLF